MSAPPASPKKRIAAMRAGRERAMRHRHREAISRVKAYDAWLKAGAPLRSIPTVPTDADFRTARKAGAR